MFWDAPWAQIVFGPIVTFVTCVHEIGHALFCLATGGSVSGLTIVSDGSGHGGLTMCHGGNPIVYTQTGYLGCAFFGCLLIWVSRYPVVSKAVLILIGASICLTSFLFVTGAIFNEWRIGQGLGSLFWGLAIGSALIWSGAKLRPYLANFLLIFLAVETSLNALVDVFTLIKISLGFYGIASFSDATNMANLTGIPALFWSLFWGLASAAMLSATIWFCYRPNPKILSLPSSRVFKNL